MDIIKVFLIAFAMLIPTAANAGASLEHDLKRLFPYTFKSYEHRGPVLSYTAKRKGLYLIAGAAGEDMMKIGRWINENRQFPKKDFSIAMWAPVEGNQTYLFSITWQAKNLERVDWGNISEYEVLDLAAKVEANMFGKRALKDYCDARGYYATRFCQKVRSL